jgi:DNA-nicking Smr family endonuclease
MSRKPIELADHALWDEVKRTIKPLAQKPANKRPLARMGVIAEITSAQTRHVAVHAAVPPKRRPMTEQPPPLAQMDRRTAQRLGRGQIEPEARLDLHGEGVETARMKLLHFLSGQRHHGVRLVLVITGKGASPFARHTLHGQSHFHTPEREGRLRREVPMWLHEEAFRKHAVGFQPAHPKHGGGGAFYIRLRKQSHVP